MTISTPLKQKIQYQQGKIVDKQKENDRVSRITIEPEVPFNWVPGQFIITATKFGGEEKIADYTILNYPDDISTIDILVDNHPTSQVGKYIVSSELGDSIKLKAPRGRFVLENYQNAEEITDEMVFIFRDIGIAAAIPLLNQLVEANNSSNIWVFNVLSKGFEEVCQDDFARFEEELDLEYNILTAEDLGIEEERLSQGKLFKKQVESIFGSYKDSTFYLSGASEFNKNLRSKLIAIGVDKNKLYREMFG